MNKILLAIICFLSISSAFSKIQVSAGARAGLNLAHMRKMDPSNGYKKKLKLGSDFGGLVRVGFGDHFGVQAEVLFSQKGQRWRKTEDSLKYHEQWVANYVEFPVLGVARFGSEKIKAVIYVGAYLGYWTGGYFQASVQQDKQTILSEHTDTDFSNLRRFDAGLATGAGVEIKAGPGVLEIAVRHDLGLVDRFKKDYPHTKIYNCNLFISAAYIIPIGK
jgi:hypothetical protein